MRNIRLIVEYDGTNYCGWQRQENGPTIQGEVEAALAKIFQEQITINGAGRTDAGVHARGQVANFRADIQMAPAAILRALNGLLPPDIVIRAADEVSFDFHARYSARERSYSYSISRKPSALNRHFTWELNYDLKVDPMRWAAASIVGTHDFESFCKANSDVEHHRCTVLAARWDENVDELKFSIRADRFLHGMVRALVGTMVNVGRSYTPLEEFVRILEKKNRSEAGQAAPAKGLMLEEVVY
ncbi:MAG TPA: tRNA pseudouridine(38-40) synthase TruA [Bacteroidota bacterium]|jgi:tRNA pseudouridine38-40 synthase|nr:tRNA pseudouridine(38-40) synthase TruA [Bacteroidota bacterium]